MISLFLIGITFFFINTMTSNNPVKIKMSLMVSSFFIFLIMKILSSNSWMPLIFCMLFLGGILMMFMILSSFLPNSKMNSSKKNKILIFIVILFNLPNNIFSFSQISTLKTFMEDKTNFIFMTIWILAIFFGFIMILGDFKLSMRSILF